MKYTFLGQTGIQVSALCMGTMTFGQDADEETSKALYIRCREMGINFFDTADEYSQGKSEAILGRCIRGERDKLIIASKVYFQVGNDLNDHGLSRRHILRSIEGTLKRLQTDYLDIYYLHHFDKMTRLEETLSTLNDLVHAGKVLYLGASNFAAWQIMKGLGISAKEHLAKFACIQPMYNLLKRQAEVELFPMAQEEGLAVFPYNLLAGGILTGKYLAEVKEGRLLANTMYQLRYSTPENSERVERFISFAKLHGFNPVSLAISWAASHPAVTASIIGARNLQQLEPAFEALEIPMNQELRTTLSALTPEPPLATDREDERTLDI